jgi:hypothetical protein
MIENELPSRHGVVAMFENAGLPLVRLPACLAPSC